MVQNKKEDMPNRIDNMFHGRSVFITGGSGFLGKLLIEKLLRTCPGIKTIYLLLREKKNKEPNQRLNDIFSNVVFSVLKEKYPDTLKKCVVIAGDVTAVDLGISAEDRQLLRNEVDFIYHSAASTRFDDTVKVAARMNTRGTKYMLDLAAECKKLKAFVHISTAYAFPKEKVLYERIYPPPANPHDILASIDFNRPGEEDEPVHLALLGDCPNTYTFTKALAEGLVAEQMDKLPVIIVRPSVVCPTFSDPLTGWCNNLQGPMGLFVGAGKGIIRSMYVKGDSYADFIPADFCVNAIILATWCYTCQDKKQRVFNATSSSEYNFNWQELIETGKDIVLNHIPFNGVVWYPGGSLKHSRLLHNICFYLFQIVPAIFIDILLFVLGYKPILYQIQRRIQKGGEVFEYYTTRPWNFSNERSLAVGQTTNAKERELYKLDVENFHIRDYLRGCMMGVRRYNLKETDDMLPAAWRHLYIMWAVDWVCKLLISFAIIYYSYKWIFAPLLSSFDL